MNCVAPAAGQIEPLPLVIAGEISNQTRIEKAIQVLKEISQLLQQRFGMSADQAQQAENAILDLVKSKVPPQFRGILDSVLGQGQVGGDGNSSGGGELGSLIGAAEGLFGAKSN
jgi:hypothetical protein